MGTENFVIYIEDAAIGTKLSLAQLTRSQENKGYTKWAVEDNFNGPSLQAEIYKTSKLGRYSDFIYGFYNPGEMVTLKLYSGRKSTAVKVIENVTILVKEG